MDFEKDSHSDLINDNANKSSALFDIAMNLQNKDLKEAKDLFFNQFAANHIQNDEVVARFYVLWRTFSPNMVI